MSREALPITVGALPAQPRSPGSPGMEPGTPPEPCSRSNVEAQVGRVSFRFAASNGPGNHACRCAGLRAPPVLSTTASSQAAGMMEFLVPGTRKAGKRGRAFSAFSMAVRL